MSADQLSVWQLAQIKEGLAEDEQGVPGVRHEEVVRWMRSWGTDHELPMPEPPTGPRAHRAR